MDALITQGWRRGFINCSVESVHVAENHLAMITIWITSCRLRLAARTQTTTCVRAGWGIVRAMSTDNRTALYGSRWQKARAGYLRSHPLCVHCQRIGRLTASTEVDHITPHKGNREIFWNHDNWQALCRSCHSSKTAREDGGFGNKASTKPRQGCTVDGWPTDSKHHWHT